MTDWIIDLAAAALVVAVAWFIGHDHAMRKRARWTKGESK